MTPLVIMVLVVVVVVVVVGIPWTRNTMDEEYTSSVPRIPLEVFHEHLRTRAASEAGTSMSIPLSLPLDEVETVYNCAVGIPSKTNERRLAALRSWYQILEDLNHRLATR